MSEFITHSREETVALGAQVAQHLAPGALIAFTGGLGAGKTAFCEGIARGLGCTDPVSSPTFAIVNYYRGPRPFAHFDLYRISTENDLCAAGEELRAILDACRCAEKLGVCLDTCHVSDAGYDIANDLDGVLAEFDRVIGLGRLKALHLNDSKNPCGAHKDRHEKIGQGYLGLDTFRSIVRHPALQGLPMILETPNELPGYAQELALLHTLD